jgi:alpha-galactosidase
MSPTVLGRVLALVLTVGLPVAGLVTASGVAPTSSLPATAVPVGAAPTPPLGWSSWNGFGCSVNDRLIRQVADAIVASDLRDAGYHYVNIDDCWMAPKRDGKGRLVPDRVKFPNGIKGVADYVHSKGLALGLYSSAGTKTCAGYPASLGHENADARSFADWGVDYLKYDNCYGQGRPPTVRYQAMADALRRSGRPIVLSICEWGENRPWEGWGGLVGGSLWRTTEDITDTWASMLSIVDKQAGLAGYISGRRSGHPSAWNDPDMLEIGNGGMTDAEYRAQFSLWAVLNAPLIAGNDVRTMSAATREILLNREVLAVDQDWGGRQGSRVRDDGDTEVWAKPMSDGSVAVVLLNLATVSRQVATTPAEVGLSSGTVRVRDLWSGKTTTGPLDAWVAPHGVTMYRVWPQS